MNATLRPATSLFLATLVALSSCSESKEQKAQANKGKSAAAAARKYTQLTEVPERERQDLEAFGRQLETDLLAKDYRKIKAAFDVPGLVDRFLDGVNIPGLKAQEFKSGAQNGMLKSMDLIARGWSEGDAKYKHLVLHDGEVKVRFRLGSEESGFSIMDLVVTRNSNGKLGIVDAFNHALGVSIVEQSRQTALPALAELDKGFLERMLGGRKGSDAKLGDLQKMGEMAKRFHKGDLQGAVDAYHQLSPEMKSDILPTALHLTVLQRMSDDEAYKSALKEAAKTHNAANFQFMLVDLYVLENNYAKAVECLDAFMAAVEKDAALLALKGSLQSQIGSHDLASAALKEALALEPDLRLAHTQALDVFLAAKDYNAVAASMRFLEASGTHEFKDNMTDPVWADFLKSPESLPWR